MPKIYFDSVERGVKVGNGDFNVIHGRKTFSGAPWEKRYFANEASINSVVDTLKPGDEINCVTVKEGKFWNLKAVEIINSGSGSNQQSGGQQQQQQSGENTGKTQGGTDYNKRQKKATAGGFREPEEISRNEALKLAVMTMQSIMSNAEYFGKIMKKTITLDVIQGATLDLAAAYNGFITGAVVPGAPESSKADLNGTDTPPTDPDDDIPF